MLALMLFLLGLVSAWWLSTKQQQSNQQQIQRLLQQQAESLLRQSMERVTLYQYGLRGMRAAVLTAGDQLDADLVVKYMQTRDLATEFPGAHGFGFVRRVHPNEKSTFLQQATQENPDFAIRQLGENGDDLYIIQYVEPISRNRLAIGLDIASEANRYEAARRAMQSGEAHITAPITLVQASGKSRQSFLILMPIYQSWRTPDSAAERERLLIGWSYAPLIMEEMLAGIAQQSSLLHLQISDISGTPQAFYQVGPPLSNHPQVVLNHPVFGRLWQWQLTATDEFIQHAQLPSPQLRWLQVMLITLLAMLCQFSVWRFVQSRRQLFDERSRLAAIVQSSNEAIIGKTLRGIVTSWNHGAERIFGYSANEAIGRSIAELIVPSQLAVEEEQILAKLRKGETIKQFITQRQHKTGVLIDVLVTVSPVKDEKGRIIAASKTAKDISEIVASRRRLDHALRQYKTLLDTINNQFLYAETSPDGRILDVNSVFCQRYGYSRDELLQQNHRILNSGYHPLPFWRHLWQAISQRQVWRGEICNMTKQGTLCWTETVIMPLLAADGEIERYISLGSDISKRKVVEAQRAELHQLIDTVLSAASEIAIISLDPNGQVQLFNRGAEQMLGYQADCIINTMHWSQLLADADIQQHLLELGLDASSPQLLLNHVAATGTPETWRTYLTCNDASRLPALLTLTAIRDADCRLLGYLLIALDFTTQQQNQADLAILRDQLNMAANVALLGIWTWQVEADELWWNDRMYAIYDVEPSTTRADLHYQHWRDRVHPDDIAEVEANFQQALTGKGKFSPVFRISTERRGVRYILGGATVEYNSNGKPWRVTGINLDVTEQHELEQQLRQAIEQADAASQAKSQFLASMSHEIRTPLNAVLGLLQLLQQTRLSDLQTDYVAKSQLAAKTLLSLLNNILDFSKIDAGKLELAPEPVALDEFFRQLAVLLGANHQNRQVELLFELDPALPACVELDSLRLQQVLLNLGGNALKFTEQGFVRVQAQLLQMDQEWATIHFAVADSGIGISPLQQQRLFSAFSQAEASISRRYGGSGLGLAISKRLLQLMHAELHMHSVPNQGSTFSFNLQLKLCPSMTAEVSIPPGIKVLLVDDQPLVRQSLALTLAQAGAEVVSCGDGAQAQQLVKEAQDSGHPFNLVLLDWQMPDLDGMATGRLLREQSQSPLQLLMVTAFESEILAQLTVQDRAQLADILIKPVTPNVLLHAISKALQHPTPYRLPAYVQQQKPLAGLQLLVVEDNALNRQVAEQLLQNAGAKVSLAVDGLMAVDLVQRQPFDVVLMDLQMPGMDGLTACRQIRQQANTSELPILAMTANATAEDKAQCLAAGMNAHISKPIDIDTLVPEILFWSKRQPSRLTVIESEYLDVTEQRTSPLLAPLSTILQRFTQNKLLLQQAIKQFSSQCQHDLATLAHCEDVAQKRAILHDLQGGAATLGLMLLSDMLRQSSVQLKAGILPDVELLTDLSGQSLQALSVHLGNVSVETPQVSHDTQQMSAVLKQLKQALAQHHMSAVDLVQSLPTEPALLLQIRQLTDNLDFAAALALLEQMQDAYDTQ